LPKRAFFCRRQKKQLALYCGFSVERTKLSVFLQSTSFLFLNLYADIVLPLALPKRTYTYRVPDELADQVRPGVRVEAPFGKSKLYSGLVERVHSNQPEYRLRDITAVLDEMPIVGPRQLQLWEWLSNYYCCTLGEVMAAALPGHLKLTSETKLAFNPAYGEDFTELNSEEYLLAEALQIQQEITIEDARKILNKKTVFPVIQNLMARGLLSLREDLQEKYKPRKTTAVRLAAPYSDDPTLLRSAFAAVEKYDRQTEVLTAFTLLSRAQPIVRKKELLQRAGVSDAVLQSLVKKGILEIYEREIGRIAGYDGEIATTGALTAAQQQAVAEIKTQFATKQAVLLHGVTGSGKTQVYMELIRETMLEGGQVLYLLPEIALTSQVIQRLQRVFGAEVTVYHSRVNYNERVEIWRSAAAGSPIFLGARSALFLPFKNLRLVIVDEEHDSSFKQHDPAPRYNARDTAIYLAGLYDAKVLLGTATPALESWYNARTGKYGLTTLPERFGGLQLPEIRSIDLRVQFKTRQMQGLFSPPLLEGIKNALAQGEQVILFQNRRGYAPIMECQVCGWSAMCKHCEVSLTYHKLTHRLRCHYCGYQEHTPTACPACGSGKVGMLGFGTEKIEDELKIFLPEARVDRLDFDTAASRANLSAILQRFEEKETDILVGTQMVTKGLDFDNVGLVGVLRADSMLKFPDFRSGERTFQLLTQVAGRAGRKKKRGLVLIQAIHPQHPVLQEVFRGDFPEFAQRELQERQEFHYPPFSRLIHLTIEHKDEKTAQQVAQYYGESLRRILGNRVLGPVVPQIPRLRGYFGQSILLKLEKNVQIIEAAKALIRQLGDTIHAKPGWSGARIAIDVDPNH